MSTIIGMPGTVRDNAGLVSVPLAIMPGCRGPECPAFAKCQGRCKARDLLLAVPGEGYPGGLKASA